MDENLISIELNPNPLLTKSSTSSASSGSASPPTLQIPTPQKPHKPEPIDLHQQQQQYQQNNIQLRPPGAHLSNRRGMQHMKQQTGVNNTNSAQYSSDSGYTESSRKSNKSSFYSDISIVVYDNLTPGKIKIIKKIKT